MRTAKIFFTEKEQGKIILSIKNAESKTTAEIRVHIDNFCFGNPLNKAKKIVHQLKMHQTQQQNGVLFYIAVWNKKLAIIGDKGIYEKTPKELWDQLVQQLIESFRKNENKAEVLCQCIETIGEWLKKYFPASDQDNLNELSDEITFS